MVESNAGSNSNHLSDGRSRSFSALCDRDLSVLRKFIEHASSDALLRRRSTRGHGVRRAGGGHFGWDL
jgi:hypothetical protein